MPLMGSMLEAQPDPKQGGLGFRTPGSSSHLGERCSFVGAHVRRLCPSFP